MELQPFLFWVIGGLTAACAIATVVTHNIVRAATWLLFTLAGTSGLFFLIGADLVGAIQLLVYVGGTMVLVVFGVMLTAEGPFINMRTSSAEWAVSAATGIALLAVLLLAIMSNKPARNAAEDQSALIAFAPKASLVSSESPGQAAKSPYTMVIGQGFSGVGVGPAHKDPAYRPPLQDVKRTTAEPPLEENKLKKADIDDLDNNLKKLNEKNGGAAKADAGKAAKVEVEKAVKVKAPEPEDDPKAPAEKLEIAPMPQIVLDPASVVRMNYLLPFEIVSVHLLVVLIAAAYLARAKRLGGRS